MASSQTATGALESLTAAAPAPPRPRFARRHPLARWVLVGAAAAASLFGALVLFDAWRVGSELAAGRAQLDALRHGSFRGLPRLRAETVAAARHLGRADEVARHSPWLRAVSWVPVAGRQLSAARSITASTARAGAIAEEAVTSIDAAARRPRRTGADRLRLMQEADEIFRTADAGLAALRVERPPGLVLPPLAGAATRLGRQLRGADASVRRARATVASLQTMFAGPRTLLVLAANNAEMRGTGGMPLQAGSVTFDGGDIGAGQFRPTSELLLPASVPIPGPMEALYGWLSPGREWRNTGSSANFPEVAPVYRAMASAAGMGEVDGVVQLDVVALADVLRVVGPVEADGIRYHADNVERLVLHDLYARYRPSTTHERHEALGQLALATLEAMKDRPWRTTDMIAAIAQAVAGRHVMLWSAVPAEQATWHRLGADGSLQADGLLLAVQNQTGNKLDYFLQTSAMVAAASTEGRSRLAVRVRVRNATPAGEVNYVAGNKQDLSFGTYRGLVTAYLPAGAFDVRASGGSVVVVGDDSPMRVVGVRLDIEPGQTRELRLEFSLPPGQRHLDVLPSGRAVPTTVRLGGTTVSDAQRRTLRW